MLLLIFLNMLLASTFTLAKAALSYIAPFSFVSVRMILAGLVMIGYNTVRDRHWYRSLSRQTWGMLFQVALFHVFFAYVLEFWALQFMTSGKASMLFSLFPLVMALLMWAFGKERLKRVQIGGLALGFAGSLALVVSDMQGHYTDLMSIALPDVVLMGAIFSAAYGWILVRRLVVEQGLEPMQVNGMSMLLGGLLCGVMAWIMEPRFIITPCADISEVWMQSFCAGMGLMVALILTANIIAYNLYGRLFKRYSPTFIGLSGISIPLFTMLFSGYFLQESLPVALIPSIMCMVAGVALFYWGDAPQKPVNQQQ